MKTFSTTRSLGVSAMVAAALLAFQPMADARDDHHHHSSRHSHSHAHSHGHAHSHHVYHHGDRVVHRGWHGHSGYVVAWGNGWRGPGYYYGPPGVSYYDEGTGVTFYASRRAVPSGLHVVIR